MARHGTARPLHGTARGQPASAGRKQPAAGVPFTQAQGVQASAALAGQCPAGQGCTPSTPRPGRPTAPVGPAPEPRGQGEAGKGERRGGMRGGCCGARGETLSFPVKLRQHIVRVLTDVVPSARCRQKEARHGPAATLRHGSFGPGRKHGWAGFAGLPGLGWRGDMGLGSATLSHLQRHGGT